MEKIIIIKNLYLRIKNQTILENITLDIEKNKITTIIGPNGAGKSSIIKSISNMLPYKGEIILKGINIKHYQNKKKLAKIISFVHQQINFPGNIKVWQYLRFAREPYKKNILSNLDDNDLEQIEKIINLCNLKPLLYKNLDILSGGELQKVHLALGLIQDSQILIIDEPVNNLDISFRFYFLDLIKKINRELKKTIILVLHDINLAAQYSDNIVIVKKGRVNAFGTVEKILTSKKIYEIFKIKSKIVINKKNINIYFNI